MDDERVADLFLGNIDFRYIQHSCASIGVSKLSGRADRVELRHHRHDRAANLSVLQEKAGLIPSIIVRSILIVRATCKCTRIHSTNI